MKQPNDEQYVEVAQGGDKAAFTRLVELYWPAVYHLAYRMLSSHLAAEDAAQETFLRAFARLDTYQPTRPFRTWLLSITAHICIDQLRHDGVLRIERLGAYEPVGAHVDPELITLRAERDSEVRGVLNQLSPASRQLLIMRYWNEMSYKEISHEAGLTENAVKSRLHRARLQLARLVQPSRISPRRASVPLAWVA